MTCIIEVIRTLYPDHKLAVACRAPVSESPQDQFNALEWSNPVPEGHKNPNPLPTYEQLLTVWDEYAVNEARDKQIAILKRIRDSKKEIGIKYKTIAEGSLSVYNCDENSMIQVMFEAFANGARQRNWRDKNKDLHALQTDDLLKIHTLMSEHIQMCEENYNNVLILIKNATTVTLVEQVDLLSGWPVEPYWRELN